jgi:uncharacterized protein YkwD
MAKLVTFLAVFMSVAVATLGASRPGADVVATSGRSAAIAVGADRGWLSDAGVNVQRAAANVAKDDQAEARTWEPDVPAPEPVSTGGSRTPAPGPAPRPFVIGSAQQSLINSDRAAAGLGPLNWSGCLAGIAAGQAQAMANAGAIFHGSGVSQDFGCRLGSSQTGENVGEWGNGACDSCINQLFMNSGPHRANILGPYRYVGTAWVVKGGIGYIAVEFA